MADITKQQLRKEIAAILKDADLADTSSKNVRLELEEKLDCKLISRKKEIDELVMEYVNSAGDKKGKKKDSEDEEDDDEADDDKESEEEEDSEEEEEKKPAKRAAKKPPAKRAKNSSESDASDGSDDDYVAEKKKPAPKPRGRKPAKKKKGSDSDGDEDWVQEKAAPRKSGGAGKGKGYTRQLTLSPELAALVGQDVMARHEVIKKMWSIIKEKNMYDPKNKQFAICDDAMQKVIGVKRFRMFGMMKYLKDHFITS